MDEVRVEWRDTITGEIRRGVLSLYGGSIPVLVPDGEPGVISAKGFTGVLRCRDGRTQSVEAILSAAKDAGYKVADS
jgi:hypothetical protein